MFKLCAFCGLCVKIFDKLLKGFLHLVVSPKAIPKWNRQFIFIYDTMVLKKKFFQFIFAAFVIIFFSENAFSFSPFEFDRSKRNKKIEIKKKSNIISETNDYCSTEFYALNFYLQVYKKFISPVRNKECPSYPSCSTYSFQAIKKFGALKGVILTADRLLHEADERKLKKFIVIDGAQKIYDPLENNLIFFYNSDKIK